jgi:hypothetical protein
MSAIDPTLSVGPLTTITWPAVTTSDTGSPVDISEFEGPLTIHVVGSGTAQMQRSNDGINYVSWGSALAANSMNDQAETRAKFLKISAVATATVSVILTGRKKRH